MSIDSLPEGYPRCSGCGVVFQSDAEITGHECPETVYIASSFNLKERVQRVYDALTDAGYGVPDVWWDESREQADLKTIDEPDHYWYQLNVVQRRAERHWRNIEEADVFVIVAPEEGTKKFNGANIELGYAIASGCACYSVGRLERSAMYEPVVQTDVVDELLRELGPPDVVVR